MENMVFVLELTDHSFFLVSTFSLNFIQYDIINSETNSTHMSALNSCSFLN